MFKFMILAALLGCSYGSIFPPVPGGKGGRIVGGEPAEISDAPFQAALLYDDFGIGFYFIKCGGTIVSSRVILTAAHCVVGLDDTRWRARVGSKTHLFGGQTAAVASVAHHERFNTSTMDYDVAVMVLAEDIVLDGINTRAIALPPSGLVIADGTYAFTSGWGSNSFKGWPVIWLRKVRLPVVNQEACKSAYSTYKTVTDRMICGGLIHEGGLDACRGDSGGPFVVDEVLVGLTSWAKDCALPGYPGVWSRVSSMRTWIDDHMKNVQ